jgi:hypothetical protein
MASVFLYLLSRLFRRHAVANSHLTSAFLELAFHSRVVTKYVHASLLALLRRNLQKRVACLGCKKATWRPNDIVLYLK